MEGLTGKLELLMFHSAKSAHELKTGDERNVFCYVAEEKEGFHVVPVG